MTDSTLHIPRLKALDSLPLNEQRRLLMAHPHNIECVNWAAYPAKPAATFGIAHSATHLYVNFCMHGAPLVARTVADQGPVSADSCVEIFLQPRPDGPYWNFEFNCIGAVNASHRLVRPEPTRLTADELATIERHGDFARAAFDERGSGDWQLTVAIPLALMGLADAPSGTTLRGNVYACASGAAEPYFLSFSPIDTPAPDYHRPEFFTAFCLD